jgi:outer membrane protein TolC
VKTLAALIGGVLVGALPARSEILALSLEEALALAVRGNLELQLAASQVDEADAFMMEARSAHLPQLGFSETALRSNDAVTAFGLRLRQERFAQEDFALPALNQPAALTGFQTSLEMRQVLFAGGADLARLRQARAGRQRAVLEAEEQQGQVRWQVAAAYWDLVLARQSAEALRQSLEAARAHAVAAQARHQQQTSPRAEVLAARSRVAQLEGEEAAAASQVRTAAEALGLLLGLDPEAQIVPADTLAPVEVAPPPPELEQEAVQRRPALRAAARQVEAARQGLRQARAGRLPRLDAFARLSLDADTPLERQGESWTAGAVLSWELFSGFHTTAALRQARARQEQAQLRLDLATAQVRRQVRQAWRQVETAQVGIRAAAQARGHAAERLRLGELNYGQGLIAAAELLDAQDQHTRAQLRYLESLRQLRAGLAYLEFAAGQPLNPVE